MRLELTGRHIDITPALRKAVQRAVAPVLRKLNDSAVSAHVVVTKQKVRTHAEVTLHARGEHFLHGAATGADVTRAVNGAVAKVDRQAEKLKDKWTTRKTETPRPRAVRALRARKSA
jgi:putative sigma-54 modulation protein